MMSLWIAIGILAVFGLIFGLILGYASLRFKVEEDPIVEKLDAILPQSQCGQCSYPGCRPYAEAVANNGGNDKQMRPRRRASHAQNC